MSRARAAGGWAFRVVPLRRETVCVGWFGAASIVALGFGVLLMLWSVDWPVSR